MKHQPDPEDEPAAAHRLIVLLPSQVVDGHGLVQRVEALASPDKREVLFLDLHRGADGKTHARVATLASFICDGWTTLQTRVDNDADVVRIHADAAGLPGLAAHDLRRTFAKLAHKGGAGLDQIQLSLGRASIQTTGRYLGVRQNLTDAPCDRLGLDWKGKPRRLPSSPTRAIIPLAQENLTVLAAPGALARSTRTIRTVARDGWREYYHRKVAESQPL
jgi:hypothetical protein